MQVGICGWPNEQAQMLDWREASNHRPKGHAALGRSTFLKPPALPEVADRFSTVNSRSDAQGCQHPAQAEAKSFFGTVSRNHPGRVRPLRPKVTSRPGSSPAAAHPHMDAVAIDIPVRHPHGAVPGRVSPITMTPNPLPTPDPGAANP